MGTLHRSQVAPPLQPFYDEIHGVCEGMFAELNNRGYLKRGLAVLTHDDRQKLANIWDLTRRFGEVLNYLYTLFSPRNPLREMQTKVLGAVGMTEDYLTSLWIQSMVSYFLTNVESVFRFTLAFLLNDKFFKDMNCKLEYATTTNLLRKLEGIYLPTKNFRKAFDIGMRTSFAHGSYWFENKELHMASDPHLRTVRSISLMNFMQIAMKANVGAMAFIDVLDNEINKGMFRG